MTQEHKIITGLKEALAHARGDGVGVRETMHYLPLGPIPIKPEPGDIKGVGEV